MIAGIDLSTFAVDLVVIDEDEDTAAWFRFDLNGQDSFDRARDVGAVMPGNSSAFWDDILAVGIEAPFGPNKNTLLRVQGAILACIPRATLVQPFAPQSWRKTAGMSGRASKDAVRQWAINSPGWNHGRRDWPQDAVDAYCIALATRTLLQHGSVAA